MSAARLWPGRPVLIVMSALLLLSVPALLGLWFPGTEAIVVVDLRNPDQSTLAQDKLRQADYQKFEGTVIVLADPNQRPLPCFPPSNPRTDPAYCPELGPNPLVILTTADSNTDTVLTSMYGRAWESIKQEAPVTRVDVESEKFGWAPAVLGTLLVSVLVVPWILYARRQRGYSPQPEPAFTYYTPGPGSHQSRLGSNQTLHPGGGSPSAQTAQTAQTQPATRPSSRGPTTRKAPMPGETPSEYRQFRFPVTAISRSSPAAEVRRLVQGARATGVARTHISKSGGYVAIGDVTVWASGAGQINPGDAVRLTFADDDGSGLIATPVPTPNEFLSD